MPLSFYQRDTTQVARELLGQHLFHETLSGTTSGIIIETEAYLGLTDQACHTFGGRRTERVASMYKTGGHSYVYFIYGIHFCFNVVTKSAAEPEAVLIRALMPVDGVELMRKRRKLKPGRPDTMLCSGPGKLCQAMGIDRSCDGLKLNGKSETENRLWIAKGLSFARVESLIQAGPRIGVDYAAEAKDWPLRFRLSEKDL